MIQLIIPDDVATETQLSIKTLGATPWAWLLFDEATSSALINDAKLVLDKAFAYNTYVFWLESTLFTSEDDLTVQELLQQTPIWTKERHKELYDDAKSTANELLPYILSTRAEANDQYMAVYNALRSTKSIKNIYHELQDLAASTHPELQAVYLQLRTQLLTVYTHIGEILDRSYTTEDFTLLKQAFAELEATHQSFLETVSTLSTSKWADIELSTLMNIDHYLYKGTKQLMEWVQAVYLTASETHELEA